MESYPILGIVLILTIPFIGFGIYMVFAHRQYRKLCQSISDFANLVNKHGVDSNQVNAPVLDARKNNKKLAGYMEQIIAFKKMYDSGKFEEDC